MRLLVAVCAAALFLTACGVDIDRWSTTPSTPRSAVLKVKFRPLSDCSFQALGARGAIDLQRADEKSVSRITSSKDGASYWGLEIREGTELPNEGSIEPPTARPTKRPPEGPVESSVVVFTPYRGGADATRDENGVWQTVLACVAELNPPKPQPK